MLSQCGFVTLQAAATYWLALAIQFPKVTSGILVSVFAALSTLGAMFAGVRAFLRVHMGIKASKAFFLSFNRAIFKAPILFFDSTPVGRILTRVRYFPHCHLKKISPVNGFNVVIIVL